MWDSLRYAYRSLRKTPGFTAMAILILALGSGANTAIFSVVDALILRPLPLRHPETLLFISASNPARAGTGVPFSLVAYDAMRQGARSFSGITAFGAEGLTLTGSGDPEQLSTAIVSANFFDVMESPPQLGRAFDATEGEAGGAAAAIISHGLWQRRFGSDRSAIGRGITLNGEPYTIIGVMPPGYPFPFQATDLWVSRLMNFTGLQPEQIRNGAGYLTAIARLKPGVSLQEAESEIATLSRQYRQDHPGNPDADPKGRLDLVPLQQSLISGIRPTLLLLTGAVALVLLIACANVAGLMLARGTGRAREISIRGALGANRATIVRQLLAESLLLTLAGAALGVLLARWGVALFVSTSNGNIPGFQPVTVNFEVLAFTLGVTLLTGIAFGLVPAFQVSRPDLNRVLREGGWGATGSSRSHRARSVVVVGQMALSVVLLIGAGLLIESFRRVQAVELGFDPHQAVTLRVSLPPARYPDDISRNQFAREIVSRMEALPGVRSAAASLGLPLATGVFAPFLAQGQPPVPIGERPLAVWGAITPGYFKTLGIPMLRGRDFSSTDDEKAPRRVIISQSLARRFFPNEDPVGKRLVYARRQFDAEIVGVAGDVKTQGLELNPGLVFYTPYPQFAWPNLSLTIRALGDPAQLLNAARAAVFSVDRDLPIVNAQKLDDLVDGVLAQRRQTMYLVAGFAAVALLLAVVGLYGVMAYSVAQRTSEIGIRQAIGAGRADILRLVLGQGLLLSIVGIGIGGLGAAAATRLLASMLFEVSATDLSIFGGISILFLALAAMASYLPASRATRVDPLEALRGSRF